MYAAIAGGFDALDRLLGAIGDAIRGWWRRFREGPLETALFLLILAVTGLRIVAGAVLAAMDEVVAWVEKAFLTVAVLAMVLLAFLDYARREIPFVNPDVPGGPNMAMVLMVWTGFLGASLAAREGRHLSVDAADRVLSPGAARWVKKVSAAMAAALCWVLMGHSWALTTESLEYADTLEGLQVWGWLAGPLNAAIAVLPGQDGVRWGALLVGGVIGVAATRYGAALAQRRGPVGRWGAPAVQAVGGVAGFFAILALLDGLWSPTTEFGDPVIWPAVEGGAGFPLWLGQVVLPLSFGLMALRFGAAAILGRFGVPVGPGQLAPPEHPGGPRTTADILLAGLFPGLLAGVAIGMVLGSGWLILVCALLIVFTGAPLFVGIGVATLACWQLISGYSGLTVASDMFEATKKQELLAIPFFVLAGNLMTQGAIADRLIGVARAVMGRTPGGLGLAGIFACVIFAAISGSSPVTVIAIGSILFPRLVRAGYPEPYSIGMLTTAGGLGIIIPPSVPMILYAIMVGTPEEPMSPLDLFTAGVLPGLFIAAVLAIYTLYRTRPSLAPDIQVADIPPGGYFANLLHHLRRGALALMLPVLVLGGLWGLLGPVRFTVNEAAAVAVVYALVVELLFHRELKLRDVPRVAAESAVMMGGLFVIIVLAISFNKFLTEREIPQAAAEWLAGEVHSPLQFLLLANLFLLALGCVMEILSAILIVAPLLAPIAAHYGIDPVHFGIIFIVNLELGYLTPPMGINLFVASTVFDRPIVKVIRAVLPFIVLMLFCLAVITFVPWLSLGLLGDR